MAITNVRNLDTDCVGRKAHRPNPTVLASLQLRTHAGCCCVHL